MTGPDDTRFSNRRIAVAGGGRYLATLDLATGVVRVEGGGRAPVTIEGVRGRAMRVSPDGAALVAVTHDGAREALTALDVATGARRALGTFDRVWDLAWTRRGVVVAHDERAGAATTAVTLVPTDGSARRRLASGSLIHRVVAASRGTRVVYFGAGGASVLDVDADQGPTRWRAVRSVANAELAPDGSRLLYTIDGGVYLADVGRAPVELARQHAEALWFSDDGARYGFATARTVTVVEGAATWRYASAGPIQGFRFAQRDGAVVLATGPRVVRWDPVTGQTSTLATLRATQTALAADVYDGGVAVWATRDATGESQARFNAAMRR